MPMYSPLRILYHKIKENPVFGQQNFIGMVEVFKSQGNEAQQYYLNVWFQKISIPPPRRELEIPEGWGGQWPWKFQRGGGVNGWISFQRVNFTFMSDINVQNCNLQTLQLRRSFLKTLLCLTVLKKPLLH